MRIHGWLKKPIQIELGYRPAIHYLIRRPQDSTGKWMVRQLNDLLSGAIARESHSLPNNLPLHPCRQTTAAAHSVESHRTKENSSQGRKRGNLRDGRGAIRGRTNGRARRNVQSGSSADN